MSCHWVCPTLYRLWGNCRLHSPYAQPDLQRAFSSFRRSCSRSFPFADQYTNSSYLTAATSVSFNAHSTLTTISSIKSVFQAVSQPPVAKIADGAGRIEAYALCVFFYVIGYIVVASAQSVYAYAAGNSIYVIGITGLFLLQNIIIADISSTRNRLFWSIFPSIPGVSQRRSCPRDLRGPRDLGGPRH